MIEENSWERGMMKEVIDSQVESSSQNEDKMKVYPMMQRGGSSNA